MMSLNKILIQLLAVVFVQMAIFTFVSGESGDEQSLEEQNATEECEDYSLQWFLHIYNKQILKQPFLHIGVNISLPDAVQKSHWSFKHFLSNNQYHHLQPEHVCSNIPYNKHEQQHDQACPWEYSCDYNPNRFPAYVFQAKCTNTYWWDATFSPHNCKQIFYPIPVLYSTGCNPVTSKKNWEWRQEIVSVACA